MSLYARAPADVNICFSSHEAPLREDHLASTTSSTHSRMRKNYCGGQQFSSFLDNYNTVLLRIFRDPDGVFAREVGMTQTMKRKWG